MRSRPVEGAERPDPLELERVALDELRRLRDLPPPTDVSWVGCATAMVAILLVVLMPFIGRAFDLPGATMGWLGLGLLLLAATGMAVGIFGGGVVHGREVSRVEGAIDDVRRAHERGDAEERVRASVRLLEAAYGVTGPATTLVVEPHEARSRLGDALPHVLAVEALLVERREIYPVFRGR